MSYYIQDEIIKAAEAYLLRHGIDYIAPTENTKKDYEPSLVVTPCTWGPERAVIAIDAYADDQDRAVLEIAGYIPSGVTSDMSDAMLLAVANQENIESDGVVFCVDEVEGKNHITVRGIIRIYNDQFPEQWFDETYNQIRDIIRDYRSSARDRGHFPPVDPKSHVEAADLPN